MGQRRCIAVWLSMMEAQKLLMLRWRAYLRGSSDIVTSIFAYKGSQYDDYGSMMVHSPWFIQNAWPKIVAALFPLIVGR